MPAKRPDRVRSVDRKGGVELLLTETIPSLGKQGDIVRVKPGYARNSLLPQGLGTVATAANKRAVEIHRQRQQAIMDAKLANLRKTANEVSKYSVTLEANATEEGHLYGSILDRDISAALKKAGYGRPRSRGGCSRRATATPRSGWCRSPASRTDFSRQRQSRAPRRCAVPSPAPVVWRRRARMVRVWIAGTAGVALRS